MKTKSCWIHIDEANRATEDRTERVTPTSTRRQQKGEEYKQVKAAGILGLPALLFSLTGTNAAGVIRDVWDVVFLDHQHSSGGWKLRLQSTAFGLGG